MNDSLPDTIAAHLWQTPSAFNDLKDRLPCYSIVSVARALCQLEAENKIYRVKGVFHLRVKFARELGLTFNKLAMPIKLTPDMLQDIHAANQSPTCTICQGTGLTTIKPKVTLWGKKASSEHYEFQQPCWKCSKNTRP